ncbi:hypothetical protein ACIQU6_40365 [Streptomyces sp. NPDC090442]|uniref:hypothetical protein n=1 Tax=Streptomyces sp. NPDC090442 TaxID=3365962 RepID=UPI0037F9F469
MTASLGFGHQAHPLIGCLVVDHAHGDRVGVLRAVAPDLKVNSYSLPVMVPNAPLVAWLAPEKGGREWTTSPDEIEAAR